MDFGSLDFETWRLVGLGFLTLGALATVIAIVAIITMFRDGGGDDGRRYIQAQYDDDDDLDDDDDRDDDDFEDRDEADDDDHDAEDRRTKVSAGPTSRERDSGPSSTSFGLTSPRESLFTVPASDSPRQPIRSTRDEPHVPSPDWYEYADVVDAKPVGDLDDDLVEALEATRQIELPPPPPPPPPAPPAAEQAVVSEQSVAPVRPEPPRRASPWFEDAAGDVKNVGAEAAPAVSPVRFPWEQAPAQTPTTAAPERPVAPPRRDDPQPPAERADTSSIAAVPDAPSRHSETRTATPPPPARLDAVTPPAERYAERADTGIIEAVPATPSRHSETRTTTPEPPARQEAQQPRAEQYVERAERVDTSATEAVPAAVSRPSEPRAVTPPAASEQRQEREESDSPTADWYDDPDGSGGERWWDGKGWTRHRRPRSGSPATTDTGRLRAARPQAAPPTAASARRNAPAAGPADTQGGQSASRPPGWYRDPSGSGERRFWDGSRWTNGT